MKRFERRRLVTRRIAYTKTFDALRTVDFSTKDKFYTPMIGGDPLRKAFTKKSVAILYAKVVHNRYQKKLKVQRELQKLEEMKEGLHENKEEAEVEDN